jgi:hypothetical protein
MSEPSKNPLSGYFRQPAIYVKLPSDGKFYPTGSLDMPPNHELPVYPMTAVDEITYRTPDALFNGTAVTSVIQSCVPNIKDAWVIPSVDLDLLLVAIRIASFGHSMEIGAVCPACQHENEYGVDLRTIIDKLRCPDYSEALDQGDLKIYFRPLDYRQMQEISNLQFEEQRLLRAIPDSDLDEREKLQRLNDAFKQLTELTITSMARSIAAVATPTAQVTEMEMIREWLANCDREVFNTVRDYIGTMRKNSELQPLNLRCRDCNHDYTQPFTLDQASFFGNAS